MNKEKIIDAILIPFSKSEISMGDFLNLKDKLEFSVYTQP